MDITDEQSVEAGRVVLADLLSKDSSKQLVGLVNNAGIALLGPLEMQPISTFKKQIDVNLFGHIIVSQAFLPFIRNSKGRIVNIVSLAGRTTLAGLGAYCASKHAMEAISDCFRLELQPWNISVSAVEPGFMKTPMVEN